MAKQRYSAEQVIEAIRKSRGLLSVAAQRLGCTRQTVENYVKRYPTVARSVKEERQKVLDVAEGKLFEKLQSGESWAIQFILKTLGKTRGYTERREITGAEGEAVELAIVGKLKRVVEMSEDEFTDFAGTVPDLGPHGTLEKMAEVEG